MRKALAIWTAAAAMLLLPSVSAGSHAANGSYRLRAAMTAQQVVTPKNKRWRVPAAVRNARGSFVGTLKVTGSRRTLRWHITYVRIGYPPQIADIHYGRPGRFGPVLVRLCAPCRSGQSGTKKITARGARSLKAGSAWITIINRKYPNGVIRGQVKVS